jgi:hypothetical protein
MKIAIIGGGWVGCHLAHKLKDTHQVSLFEKNNHLFSETSYNNQNRLHLGFHYSRNNKTRNLCKNTFDRFINDYGFSVSDISENLYCIPENESLIDFDTYLKIFDDFDFDLKKHNFKNVSGCISVNEKHINFESCFKFFNKILKDIVINEFICDKKLENIKDNFDLVINCTNNHLEYSDVIDNPDYFFELTISLIYEKVFDVDFGAVTMVDGDLFSIYPYSDNTFTVTDVVETPIKKFYSINELEKYKKLINTELISEKINKIETKILKYYPYFVNQFKYNSYFLSVKSKRKNDSSDRYPVIIDNGKILNCFTGKIQGIYIIEDYITKKISQIKL